MNRRFLNQMLLQVILFVLALLIWIPLWILIFGSFMDRNELLAHLAPIYDDGGDYVSWLLIPQYPTLQAYLEVLLDTPEFFVMFWNSCKLAFPTLLGRCIICIPAAWGLARYQFKGKRILFFVYIVVMLLPFQVTMVSSYLALNKLMLLDTIWAVILPAIFSTFPVFIMTRFFTEIPNEIIEAASLDRANDFQIFLHIGLPMGIPGIISAIVLSFIEDWNAIEQPLTFIKDKKLWPLTLYLPDLSLEQISFAFVSSIIIMLPAIFVFSVGKRHLEAGIGSAGLKG